MAKWYPKRNPPLKPWEKECEMCTLRWPKAKLVKQRGLLICQRPGCLDEPNPRDPRK